MSIALSWIVAMLLLDAPEVDASPRPEPGGSSVSLDSVPRWTPSRRSWFSEDARNLERTPTVEERARACDCRAEAMVPMYIGWWANVVEFTPVVPEQLAFAPDDYDGIDRERRRRRGACEDRETRATARTRDPGRRSPPRSSSASTVARTGS